MPRPRKYKKPDEAYNNYFSKHKSFSFTVDTDSKAGERIIEKLNSVPSRSAYIRSLILKDIANE